MDEITDSLKQLARRARAARIPYNDDSSEHHAIFSRAVANVLSTELALFTYAQIIDGLPTDEVAYDRRSPGLHGNHPIEHHVDLCPGALERASEFRASFDPAILSFDPKLLNSYRRAIIGSKQFSTRLIELVSVALHGIAVILFQLDIRLHDGDVDAIVQWTEDDSAGGELGLPVIPPRVTIFNHPYYLDDDVYPDGVADVVGYWAEDRILGGVTTFDRRAEESAPQQPPNAYFFSCRRRHTDRYWQLLDHQQQALIDFFLTTNPGQETPCPLPTLCSDDNTVRIDEQYAIIQHHVYRDIWERKPPTREHLRFSANRPQDAQDFPEHAALIESIKRQWGDDLEPEPNAGSNTERKSKSAE
ncbi:hypothetical protein QBC40DRAFT_41203 [Triangularia verruculosa]|uniref:Uncharacterized protein n=1 Tax=Triangularia verruculosa TaxID=2587418 RepID=A0AAN6XL47_9PEZI|nr:hypothetical protein QBC40DRAFT_41203 [Triangularia verruculosa]